MPPPGPARARPGGPAGPRARGSPGRRARELAGAARAGAAAEGRWRMLSAAPIQPGGRQARGPGARGMGAGLVPRTGHEGPHQVQHAEPRRHGAPPPGFLPALLPSPACSPPCPSCPPAGGGRPRVNCAPTVLQRRERESSSPPCCGASPSNSGGGRGPETHSKDRGVGPCLLFLPRCFSPVVSPPLSPRGGVASATRQHRENRQTRSLTVHNRTR